MNLPSKILSKTSFRRGEWGKLGKEFQTDCNRLLRVKTSELFRHGSEFHDPEEEYLIPKKATPFKKKPRLKKNIDLRFKFEKSTGFLRPKRVKVNERQLAHYINRKDVKLMAIKVGDKWKVLKDTRPKNMN